jgi:uncharacterized delta-60 repeat protein
MKSLFTANCYRLLFLSFFLIQQTSIFNNQLKAQSPGDLDVTFGTNGKVTTAIGSSDTRGNSVVIQADGKIVVAGSSKSSTGSYYNFALARYSTNGTLDYTFGTGGTVTTAIGSSDACAYSVAIQADGKIVVAGYSNTVYGSDFALVRYNTNGTLDNTFSSDGIVTTDFGYIIDVARSVIVQADGKILVAGHSNADFALARYNTNGTLDNTFGTNGKLYTKVGFCVFGSLASDDIAYAMAIQANGKILVAGKTYEDFALVRYNTNGSLDSSGFSSDGIVITAIGTATDEAYSVAVQADGKIVLGGYYDTYINYTSSYDFALARYNTDGTIDNTFSPDGIVTTAISNGNDYGYSVAIQADGKILLAGSSKCATCSDNDFALARYNTDGTLDNTFSTDGIVITAVLSGDDLGRSVAIQADGKIIVAGNSTVGSNSDFALVRYWGDISVSIDEIVGIGEYKIYPNPTKGVFTIQGINQKAQGTSQISQIEIYDVYGNLVTTKQCVINKEINISTLPKGVYFIYIKAQYSSNVVIKKIVKI